MHFPIILVFCGYQMSVFVHVKNSFPVLQQYLDGNKNVSGVIVLTLWFCITYRKLICKANRTNVNWCLHMDTVEKLQQWWWTFSLPEAKFIPELACQNVVMLLWLLVDLLRYLLLYTFNDFLALACIYFSDKNSIVIMPDYYRHMKHCVS